MLPKALQDPASVLLDICAYAGTGNVLKVQHLLHICSEHVDKEKDEVCPGSLRYYYLLLPPFTAVSDLLLLFLSIAAWRRDWANECLHDL